MNGKRGVATEVHPVGGVENHTKVRYTVKLDGGEAFKLKGANAREEGASDGDGGDGAGTSKAKGKGKKARGGRALTRLERCPCRQPAIREGGSVEKHRAQLGLQSSCMSSWPRELAMGVWRRSAVLGALFSARCPLKGAGCGAGQSRWTRMSHWLV